jgi:hypothetical protein
MTPQYQAAGAWGSGMFGSLVFESRGQLARAITWRNAALIALAVFIFVAVRPNAGVRHDGILYAAQALFRLQPEIFGGDVFFKFGSQESFTLFGRLYAAVITALGFSGATLFLLAFGQLSFFLATLLWCRAALPERLVFGGLLAVCVSAGGYGGMMIFHYAEPFVTARPLAEALVVAGLPFLLVGKRWIALALMLCAASLHPLIALSGLAAWWMCQVFGDRRWVWLGVLAVLSGVVLAVLGIGPFADLLKFQGGEWRAGIEEHTPHVYIFTWTMFDYCMLGTDFALLLWTRQVVDAPLRKVLGSLLVVGALFLAVSVVGADLLSNVLVTSLQLWRAQWLLHFAAMSLVPLLVVTLLRGANVQVLCGLLVTYGALNRGLATGFLAILAAVVLALAARRKDIPIERKLVFVAGAALAGGMLYMWGSALQRDLSRGELAGHAFDWVSVLVQSVRKPPVGPLLLLLAFAAAAWRWPRSLFPAIAAIAVSGLLVSVSWDQRSGWTRVMEHYASGNHPFARHIAPEEEVYWSDQALAPWLMLHRRTYVSVLHTSGLPFNRESAERILERSKVLSLFEFQDEVCQLFNSMKGKQQDTCAPDIVTIRTACETDPKLSWVVSQYALQGAWRDAWEAEVGGHTYGKYYLYGCRDLLAADKARTPS